MARARNIKPGFFTNDSMAEVDPLGRLLFLGLTTIANFKGCIEWRTKRIKAQVLPYDDCDIDALGKNLEQYGFIRYYSDGEKTYVKIVNFEKHQNPHKNEREAGTDIPDFTEEMRQAVDLQRLAIKTEKIGTTPDNNGTDRADSLNLIPDSLNLIPSPTNRDTCVSLVRVNNDLGFAEFYEAYPKKTGRQDAHKAWKKLNPSPALINRILLDIAQRIERGAWCTGHGKSFIPGPAPYLNQEKWTDEIIPRPEFKPHVDFSQIAREAEIL